MRPDPRLLAVVALGGAVGTALRYGLGRLLPPGDGVPWATLLENVVGAFLLGMLLEALVRAGREDARRRFLRLGLGTGLLGGFTTFSALALETRNLLAAGDVLLGVGYPLGSVVLGVVAATAGVTLAARVRGNVGLLPPDPDASTAAGSPTAPGSPTDRRLPPVERGSGVNPSGDGESGGTGTSGDGEVS
ncbi:CrcB family protein [Sanguibacter massiliensis]|uniref:CrcB family protein n=1 Tax=Sanguibacter massiliensis TaxID=1973217 RepID=UPI000C846D71